MKIFQSLKIIQMISFSWKWIVWLIHSTSQRNSSPASFHFEYEKFVMMIKVSLYSDMMNYGMNEMIMMMFERKMTKWIEYIQINKNEPIDQKEVNYMNLIEYVDK